MMADVGVSSLDPHGLAPAAQNRVIELTVGSGSATTQYNFAVDTGSSLLEIACQSVAAQANCGGRALSGSYVLTAANTLSSAAACAATGIDCYVEGAGQPGVCFFSQGVSCFGGCWMAASDEWPTSGPRHTGRDWVARRACRGAPLVAPD